MLPYKTIIEIQKKSETPVYIQIANGFAREIRNGILKPGSKLPGARSLAELIEVNRNTVVSAYEELNMQGYVELLPKKGAFISKRIPEIKPKKISETHRNIDYPEDVGFTLKANYLPEINIVSKSALLEFNDGLPDERIAPIEELTRAYRSQFRRGSRIQFGYSDVEGNPRLRQEISLYLNETRGLQTTFENIIITKGSQMAIYLISQLLLRKGDVVLVGETSYHAADLSFILAGTELQRIPVDELGINTDAIEEICKTKKIRAVYVTPHHHFPTTVTMSACRRMNLLALAEKWGFAIIEDDYDYDFHYKSAPILPLASADSKGMVINIGSFSKNFAPSLRVGYLVAPKNFIKKIASLRYLIDRQGDYMMEQAIAELFKEGIIKRHLRKAIGIYQLRRDFLTKQLTEKLGHSVTFKVPDGGLAIWAYFDKAISLEFVAKQALKKELKINDGSIYNSNGENQNATRLGFASLDFDEIEKGVELLAEIIKGKKGI